MGLIYEATNGNDIVAVPFKGKILALGTVEERDEHHIARE
jgi:hypothetical protein